MKSSWKIKEIDKNISDEFSSIFGLSKNLSDILCGRNIKNLYEAYNFLTPRLSGLHSPFMMKDMDIAVNRIRRAIEKNEKIGIFSDSDLDGLTSLTILTKLLEKFNIKPFYRYLTGDEYYGLTEKIIDEFISNSIGLMITLDSGIRDVAEISYAKKNGIDTIICDHHEPAEIVPDAIIVNPKQDVCPYPFKDLAGVGVTFKLCHALLMSYLPSYNKRFLIITNDSGKIYISFIKNGILEEIKCFDDIAHLNDIKNDIDNIIFFDIDETGIANIFKDIKIYNLNNMIENTNGKDTNYNIKTLCEKFSVNENIYKRKIDIINYIFSEIQYSKSPKIMDFINLIISLVSIGTIADIMPVIDENRTIAHYGIKNLGSGNHPGLSVMMNNKPITSKSISWDIAPVLNTPGRFGKTYLTADFLLEQDQDKAGDILNSIIILNDERKKIISDLYKNIIEDIENGSIKIDSNLLFLISDKIPEGLSGLLANRLIDFIDKPVIIVSLCGKDGIVKGSGRTRTGFNLLSMVEPHEELFIKIGGHAQAFGFTAKRENLDIIRKKISSTIGDNYKSSNDISIDIDLHIDDITEEFIRSIEVFEPFGYKNEEPIFISRSVNILNFYKFGNEKNHGKLILKGKKPIEAIGWNMGDRLEGISSKVIDIVYRLEMNLYNGNCSPRMVILDID